MRRWNHQLTISLVFLLQFGHVGFIFSQLSMHLLRLVKRWVWHLLLVKHVIALRHPSHHCLRGNLIATNGAHFILNSGPCCLRFLQLDLSKLDVCEGPHDWISSVMIYLGQQVLLQHVCEDQLFIQFISLNLIQSWEDDSEPWRFELMPIWWDGIVVVLPSASQMSIWSGCRQRLRSSSSQEQRAQAKGRHNLDTAYQRCYHWKRWILHMWSHFWSCLSTISCLV